MPIGETEIGQFGQQVNDDLEKLELSSKLRTMAVGEGFDPTLCCRFHSQASLFFKKLDSWSSVQTFSEESYLL